MNQQRNVHYLAYTLFILMAVLFAPFWKPFIISGIFSLALYPFLKKRYAKKIPNIIILSCVTVTSFLIIAPVLMGTYSLSSKVVAYSKNSDQLKTNNLSKTFSDKINEVYETIGLPKTATTTQFTERISSSLGTQVLAFSATMISDIPELIVSLFIFALMMYLFLYYASEIKQNIIKWKVLSKKDLEEFIKIIQTSCSQCLLSLIIVGIVQSLVVTTGALISGFSNGALIFLITFICSFIPVLGTAPITCALAFWKLVTGDANWGFFLLFIAVVAGTVDNVLKPMLVKRGVKMDGIITLISIIGALIIFGLPGLFIGPVLANTAGQYFHKEFDSK